MDCESCHGPGKPHADAEEAAKGEEAATAAANKLIFAFRGTAQENAARCQSCHESGRAQQGFAHSPHANAALACSVCHSPHLVEAVRRERLYVPLPQEQAFALPRPDAERRWLAESQLKESQPALCYSCHAQVRAQFAQPFHHRVPEGAMKCSDCHNAHGTQNHATLTSPGWETCTTCHADKHGPFLFEHAAVKVEGCAICHSPHGATVALSSGSAASRGSCAFSATAIHIRSRNRSAFRTAVSASRRGGIARGATWRFTAQTSTSSSCNRSITCCVRSSECVSSSLARSASCRLRIRRPGSRSDTDDGAWVGRCRLPLAGR